MLTCREPRSLTPPARRGFTLIELLVVISIIAVLAALTATAVFGVRRGMQTQNCEATLSKLNQKLENRVKELRDQIQGDVDKGKAANEYNAALAATGNNKDAAKSVMLYARLKQQLPMSYAEGNTPFVVSGFTYQPSPAFREFSSMTANPATIEQSAVCLHAAINAMGMMDGLEQQVGTGPVTGQKVFMDGFNTPIGFVRLGYDGAGGELNLRPYAINPAQDPFDTSPNNAASTALTALWGTLNCPQLTDAGPYSYPTAYRANPALNNRNHAIVLISAGPNKVFAEPTLYDGDNILSYRLRREGANGN